MIRISEEDYTTLYITRGDKTGTDFNRLAFEFPILNTETNEEELYEFQLDDKISFVVMPKKGYTKEETFRVDYTIRDLGYTKPTTTPEIVLTSRETKEFELLNKKKEYWYSITLNDDTTILGFDEDGAKKVIVFPEVND